MFAHIAAKILRHDGRIKNTVRANVVRNNIKKVCECATLAREKRAAGFVEKRCRSLKVISVMANVEEGGTVSKKD